MNFRKNFILLLVALPAVFATDYCRRDLCGKGERHIACGNKGEFAARCGQYKKTVALTPEEKAYIVEKHNALRNLFAQGFDKFLPAAHMATMEWDEELAKLADFNVRQCDMEHDECRSTDRFPHAGQNLAYQGWKGQTFTLKQLIDSDIQGWFDEYKHCPQQVMKKYPRNWPDSKAIGHLTAMVQEKNNRVGCAVWIGVQDGWDTQFFACNYAYTNILDKPVYTPGKAASKCTSGVNPKFTALCSTKEVYDLKKIN